MDSKNSQKLIKEIIFKFLNPREYKVFIFGSRAIGKAQKFSDYDIGIMGKNPVGWGKLALINEAFEDSNLLSRVDVVDFSLVSSGFRRVALSKIKRL